MHRIVLLRHGESEWNRQGRFTGWTDVVLSEKGVAQARRAGKLLMREGFAFDIAYTSVLRRATDTMHLCLSEMDLLSIPEVRDWRLNDRHYGALEGLNKAETARKFGGEQLKIWRRSYDTPPPALSTDDDRFPGNDPRYADLSQGELPRGESLKETADRVLPVWHEEIAPAIRSGKRVIISAHSATLRAIVGHIDELSDQEIPGIDVPTGVPLVYELDEELKPVRHYHLGDAEAASG